MYFSSGRAASSRAEPGTDNTGLQPIAVAAITRAKAMITAADAPQNFAKHRHALERKVLRQHAQLIQVVDAPFEPAQT